MKHAQSEELARKLTSLITRKVMFDELDELVWDRVNDQLSAATCYKEILHLRLKYFSKGVQFFDWKKVWIKGVPSKVAFCLWTVVRDKILTHNNLQRKGFAIVSQCLLCGHAREDAKHIFRECALAKLVWNYFIGEQNMYKSLSLREHIARWKCFGKTDHGRVMTSYLLHAIVWVIWKERNRRNFDEKASSFQQLITKVKSLVWGWYLDSEVNNKVPVERVMFDWYSL